jgi:hypothetical protein
MLIDSSVARSFAVVGWTSQLVAVCGGCIQLAYGVHSADPAEHSELRGIRDALMRQANKAGLGSGQSSKALAAAHGLDELLSLPPSKLAVLALEDADLRLAVRLQSREADDRQWRNSLGARARRLDAGEAASIAIAYHRGLAFASDDEDALVLWRALTSSSGLRTRDLMHRAAADSVCDEAEARLVYHQLQTDDLHNLGGPPW